MQFSRLSISNWKNFTSVDVPLISRMFLVGPNASGKSNLLDIFRFLRDIAKQKGGGFQAAVEDRGGVSCLRCLSARRYSDIMVRVDIGSVSSSPDAHSLWGYSITFNQDNQRKPVLKEEHVWKAGHEILSRPDEADRADPQRLRQTYLEQLNVNLNFRDLARFLESTQYFHLVPHILRDPERFKTQRDDPFGSDFLERLASSSNRTRNARLHRIEQILKIVVPQLSSIELKRDSHGTPHLSSVYKHWRFRGAKQDERVLSDGTLRFLGFLWSTLDGEGPLLLEEPELSLHTGIVRRLARLIRQIQHLKNNRQVLVSTHSSELVSDRGIGGEEVLVLQPGEEGTRVWLGKDNIQIAALLNNGASVADAVMPYTEPPNAIQLELGLSQE